MQIVFVSNYINHHQIPLSNELYALTNGQYTFIQTEPMEEERINLGWNSDSDKMKYVLKYYEEPKRCDDLILESECVIFGGTEKEELIVPRLEANKLTLRYSERLYKEGRWKFISPRGLIKKYNDHTQYNNKEVYLLCAGAYVSGDFKLIHAYKNKKFKFGYFPEFVEYSDLHELRRKNTKVEILWVGRFIDWKHPEVMLSVAKHLYDNNMDAHITMVGVGELHDSIEMASKEYDGYVSIDGSKTPSEVRELMRKSDILISTSDMKEGWGAVINEGMNSGCVVIAPREIGAAPFLIQNGVSGFMYEQPQRVKKLLKTLDYLCTHSEKRKEIGNNAYNTILTEWNHKIAARRIYEFISSTNKAVCPYEKGPLSKA